MGTMDLDLGLNVELLTTGLYKPLADRLRTAGFTLDTNDRGNPTRQRWLPAASYPGVAIDFLIQPTLESDRSGRLRNIQQDFAAVIAPRASSRVPGLCCRPPRRYHNRWRARHATDQRLRSGRLCRPQGLGFPRTRQEQGCVRPLLHPPLLRVRHRRHCRPTAAVAKRCRRALRSRHPSRGLCRARRRRGHAVLPRSSTPASRTTTPRPTSSALPRRSWIDSAPIPDPKPRATACKILFLSEASRAEVVNHEGEVAPRSTAPLRHPITASGADCCRAGRRTGSRSCSVRWADSRPGARRRACLHRACLRRLGFLLVYSSRAPAVVDRPVAADL